MSVFTEIQDLSRTIESGYPGAIANLARDGELLRDSRREGSKYLADDRHGYRSWLAACKDYENLLAELGNLVSRHLPDVATNLRIVTDGTGLIQAKLSDVDALIGELRTIRSAAVREEETKPKAYLLNWTEILDAVGLNDDKEKRRAIRRYNDEYGGPIIVPKQGSSPKVDKAKLVAWWNGLERRFKEIKQRERDKQATVAEQYSHGREGTVIPGVSGSEKKRRQDHKR